MKRIALSLVLLSAACGGGSTSESDMGTPSSSSVVINELYPHGTAGTDVDFAELKNKGDSEADVGGYKVRDSSLAHLFTIPTGTVIPAGGYLLLYCDDPSDGGAAGIYTGWGLSEKNGDEFHLLGKDGKEVDSAIFTATLSATKSWGRLPDGSVNFAEMVPTPGKQNF